MDSFEAFDQGMLHKHLITEPIINGHVNDWQHVVGCKLCKFLACCVGEVNGN